MLQSVHVVWYVHTHHWLWVVREFRRNGNVRRQRGFLHNRFYLGTQFLQRLEPATGCGWGRGAGPRCGRQRGWASGR